jgi:hypothetical protein
MLPQEFTTAKRACGGLFPSMLEASLVMQSWAGICWTPALFVLFEACRCPSDLSGVPTCRYLYNNKLSRTLPKEWSTMRTLNYL